MDLNEQLKEEQRKRQQESNVPNEPTPQQRKANADSLIDALKTEMELDSIKQGFANLKQREQALVDKEKDLAEKDKALKESIGAFELEQKKRVEQANERINNANKYFEELQVQRKEAEKLMSNAIRVKAEAETIIKSQTVQDKDRQERQSAYADNMEESLELLNDVSNALRQQEDNYAFSLSGIIKRDLSLIGKLQDKQADLQTLTDIISVDMDRILELCEYLQNSKKDYSQLIKFLGDSTEWLSERLVIEWDNKVPELPV